MLKLLFKLLPENTIYAHCDIPCGIYDPHQAQVAAHSVIRMTKMLQDLEKNPDGVARESQVARLTRVKEDHAEIVKHEVRIIWGDYFKSEMMEKYPDLHKLVLEIMKLASKAKQSIDLEAANNLLDKVQEFAEIFYETKGVIPKRVKSLYPTEGEIVTYEA